MIRSPALPPPEARLAHVSLLRVLVARGLYRPDARALAEALLAQAALEPPPRIAGGGRGVQSRVDRAGSA